MLKRLVEYQNNHIDSIIEETEKYRYRFKRYQEIFTFALFFGDVPENEEKIKKRIRRTDHCIKLEKDLMLLVYEMTPIDGAIVASEKLLSFMLDEPKKKIYVAAVECNSLFDDSLTIHTLFTIIEYAIEHNHVNEVVDTSYLDGIY